MNVEDRVRGTLTDDRYALPGWPDPVQRVTAGVRRRLRRRRIAVAVSVAAVTAVVAAVPALLHPWRGPTPVAGDGVVAWSDSPVSPPTHLARRAPRPDARDCTFADLNRLAWVGGTAAGAGTRTYTLLLPDETDSRCTLRGQPSIVATDVATGRRVRPAVRAVLPATGPAGEDQASQYPATIDPGEPARVDLVTFDACAGQRGAPRRYRDVAIVVQGHEFPVSGGLPVATACPIGIGEWRVLPPPLYVPFVVASIDAPAQVRRGQLLDYTVTLENSGNLWYHLVPCPAYTEALAGFVATYRLNCTALNIAPHTSVRYQMRLSVPAGLRLGKSNLTWMAVDASGRVIVADLAAGGAPVQVTQ
jgi:hypothetical protein